MLVFRGSLRCCFISKGGSAMATGKFEIYKKETGFVFHLVAVNGLMIGTSQVYASEKTCKEGVASVRKNAPAASLENQTAEGFKTEKNPKFAIFKDKSGGFRFRLSATNGEIILASQAYKEEKGAAKGIESVRVNAPAAVLVDLTDGKKGASDSPDGSKVLSRIPDSSVQK